jgi:hypothetical protein
LIRSSGVAGVQEFRRVSRIDPDHQYLELLPLVEKKSPECSDELIAG